MNLPGPVRRNERDCALFVEGLCEEIRAREPIHVARDRQAEEVQERWRNVNHCTATLTRCDDRRPVREQEPVRSSLVCAAELRVAGDAFRSVPNDTDDEAELLIFSPRLDEPPTEKQDDFWPST